MLFSNICQTETFASASRILITDFLVTFSQLLRLAVYASQPLGEVYQLRSIFRFHLEASSLQDLLRPIFYLSHVVVLEQVLLLGSLAILVLLESFLREHFRVAEQVSQAPRL